jgi:hypothetical protein
MCGDQGVSIDAPLPPLPTEGGKIQRTPGCGASSHAPALNRLSRPSPPQPAVSFTVLERALPSAWLRLAAPRSHPLKIVASVSTLRAGHALQIYRPPRA